MHCLKFRNALALAFMLVFSLCAKAQATTGYVIAVENGKIYLDLTKASVTKGDMVTVMDGTSSIASIEIEDASANYSQGRAIPSFALDKIKNGMTVRRNEKETLTDYSAPTTGSKFSQNKSNNTMNFRKDNKVGVYIAPAQVNDVVGVGHFGGYVSDVLMEQMMFCENIRLLDRTVLREQINETDLTGDYIDPSTAIERGKIAGAKYVIQVTMQKPDVVNISTGIPLASIMGALQSGFNRNLGAQYMSNMEVATLQAAVSISARVVDIQTGEIMFMASGTGKAKGKSQLSMEYGALGGAKLNGGVDGFKQTVTGQAIQKAFISIGRSLNKYFSGKATSKVMGTASGYGNYADNLKARGMSLYMGTDKLDDDAVKNLFYDNSEIFFKYKSAKKQRNLGKSLTTLGVLSLGVGLLLLIDFNQGNLESEPYAYGCVAGGAILTTIGIFTNKSASSKIKNIANEYNKKNSYAECRLDLVAPSTGGIGLRLTF